MQGVKDWAPGQKKVLWEHGREECKSGEASWRWCLDKDLKDKEELADWGRSDQDGEEEKEVHLGSLWTVGNTEAHTAQHWLQYRIQWASTDASLTD